MSERHREALAHLLYGIKGNGGFVLLTGEVGTGKTTVCRCLLEKIPENTSIAFILNPKLTVEELLETICDEFGLGPTKGKSIKVYVDLITGFLLGSHAKGIKTVLIIDEAQNLSVDVLEQLRLLTNLETNERKLLQIILLGQPELKEQLSRPELRQLAQRITARYHLEPLSEGEVGAYVNHRLAIAGGRGRIFPGTTIRHLFRLSQGTPRLINIICDRALLGAYVQNQDQVNVSTLKKAAQEVFGDPSVSPAKNVKKSNWLPAGFIIFFVSLVLAAGFYSKQTQMFFSSLDFIKQHEEKKQVALAEPPEQEQIAAQKPSDISEIEEQDSQLQISENPQPATPETNPPEISSEPAVAQSIELTPLQWPAGAPRDNSRDMAYQSLFAGWGIPYTPDKTLSACNVAETYNLRCLDMQGSLESLLKLNRPAVLTFYDGKSEPFFATLTSITDQTATFIIGQQNQTVKREEIATKWRGEYSIFWARPLNYTNVIIQGKQRGLNVAWLDKKLAYIQGRPASPQSFIPFDEALALQVKQFQFNNGLVPDGIIGPQTIIHLNSACGIEVPKLIYRQKVQ